jgi:hypothetical protein
MTDFTIKTPAPKASAKTTAKAGVKRAKAAVDKAVETVAEKTEVARAYAVRKGRGRQDLERREGQGGPRHRRGAPRRPGGRDLRGRLVFGFLLARNFDR